VVVKNLKKLLLDSVILFICLIIIFITTNKYVRSHPKSLTFVQVTDTHYISTKSSIYKLSLNHLKTVKEYANKNSNVDFITHTGDVVDGNEAVSENKKDLNDCVRMLADGAKCPVYLAKGNHDDCSWWVAQDKLNRNYTMCMTPEDWYDIAIKHLENTVVQDNNDKIGAYYYKDFDAQKIRVIVLNSNDIPFIVQNNLPKYYGQWTYGFSNEQLNWLAHVALNFSDKGKDKSNWAVITFSHVPFNKQASSKNDSQAKNGENIEGILKAFMNGSKYVSKVTTGDFGKSVSIDFSQQGAMEYIAHFYGHIHKSSYVNINGIRYISVLNSGAFNSNKGETPDREVGTSSEDAWDVITIDRQNKKIIIKGMGADTDREISY
jgi:predicted MPP superfamily phosphohydrolase